MRLEDKLFEKLHSAEEVDEEEFLLALGMSEDKVPEYRKKMDLLEAEFEVYMEQKDIPYHDAEKLAHGLREFLWNDKKDRYNSNSLLKDVIDAQSDMDDEKKVGNCNGLTALYWALASRFGLNQKVMVTPNHIYSRVILDEDGPRKTIDIENTKSSGIVNSKGYELAQEHGFKGMLFASLCNRAKMKRAEGNILGAIDDCMKASELGVFTEEAHYNMSILKSQLGLYEDALKDIDKALELNPNRAYFHNKKGKLLSILNKPDKGLECLEKAVMMDPLEVSYQLDSIKWKKKSGKFEEAIRDYACLMLVDERKPDYLLEMGKLKCKIGDASGLKDLEEAARLK